MIRVVVVEGGVAGHQEGAAATRAADSWWRSHRPWRWPSRPARGSDSSLGEPLAVGSDALSAPVLVGLAARREGEDREGRHEDDPDPCGAAACASW